MSASSAAKDGDRAELIAYLSRISRGERAALENLYRRTSAKLFGVCLRILSDRAEAEDVLQEVYLTVWNKAAQFDAERGLSPITWLVSIARNRALDRLRSRTQRFGGLDEAAVVAQRGCAALSDRAGRRAGPGAVAGARAPRPRSGRRFSVVRRMICWPGQR